MMPSMLFTIIFNGWSIAAIIPLILVVMLLVASAFASASETAYFALTPQDLEQISNTHNLTSSIKIMRLREQPELLLATILISNNFVNVCIVVLSAMGMSALFDFSQAPVWGFIIQTVIITFLLLLFGEIMPKIFAAHNALKMCRISAATLLVVEKAIAPMARLLVKSTDMVHKRLERHKHDNLSMDELQTALEITSDDIDEDKDILEGIVRFGNIAAGSIMTSRLDMVAIDSHSTYSQVLAEIEKVGYSRIPVYEGTCDTIRGILYIKDLIPHLNKGNTFRWQTLVRPATFVPETRKIDDLLQDFQKLHVHIAIVVDEFGGTLGIVTMEDVLEEIVGDINDEYDDDEQLYTKTDEHTFVFEGKIMLNDFFKLANVDAESFGQAAVDVDTLAGLLLEVHGEMPKQRERINVGNCTFVVLAVDKRRIKKVKVIIDRQKQREDENSH